MVYFITAFLKVTSHIIDEIYLRKERDCMKASMRHDKGSCNHNDRSFKTNKADHLKEGKVYAFIMENGKWEQVPIGKYALEKKEKEKYKELFGKHFTSVNARYKEQGHSEKCKTLEHHRKHKYAPIETIYQIGKSGEWTDVNELLNAVNSTLGKMKNKLGKNMEIFSLAIHCDEESVHIHVRWCVVAHDKENNPFPDKENGLKEAEIELPNPEMKPNRDNNRLIHFTDIAREYWYDEVDKVLEPYGIKVDRETDPKNRSRRNKRVQQHRAEVLGEKVIQQGKTIDRLTKRIQELTEAQGDMDMVKYEAMQNVINNNNLQSELAEEIENLKNDYSDKD